MNAEAVRGVSSQLMSIIIITAIMVLPSADLSARAPPRAPAATAPYEQGRVKGFE